MDRQTLYTLYNKTSQSLQRTVIKTKWYIPLVLQETVTGSTLNGRKEYLKADEGDKDKWEFLNFADAWTPTEKVLPLQGNTGNLKDDVFFTHVSQMQ